jgi:hypothetical protein
MLRWNRTTLEQNMTHCTAPFVTWVEEEGEEEMSKRNCGLLLTEKVRRMTIIYIVLLDTMVKTSQRV